MGRYALEQLRKRGIACHLETRLELGGRRSRGALDRRGDGHRDPGLDGGGETATPRGRRPASGSTRRAGSSDGRRCRSPTSTTPGSPVTAAAIPDLANGPGTWTSPSAQHAVRQAKVLGDNIVASLRGFPAKDYHHKYVGSVASLGLYKGVAQVYGIKLKGFVAWFMHRTYHMSRMPTFARKAQVLIDWTQAFFFRREIVSLWGMHEPFQEFQEAAGAPPPPRGLGGSGSPGFVSKGNDLD